MDNIKKIKIGISPTCLVSNGSGSDANTQSAVAIRSVLDVGQVGEAYGIGGWNEKPNLELVHAVCLLVDELGPRPDGKSYGDQITFVAGCPGHDRHYALNASKIERELGWKPAETFDTGILLNPVTKVVSKQSPPNYDKPVSSKSNCAVTGLYIPPMMWRDLDNFSSGAVCLVLASAFYDEGDYFRNYEDFLCAARKGER